MRERGPGFNAIALTLLVIVLLSVDAAARAILAPVQVPSFPLRHLAVGFGSGFFGVRHGLLSFEPSGFPPVQLAAAYALPDAPLLVALAPVNSGCVLRESGKADAEYENSGQYYTGDLLHAVLLKGLNFGYW
jgi:hypothetical protein